MYVCICKRGGWAKYIKEKYCARGKGMKKKMVHVD